MDKKYNNLGFIFLLLIPLTIAGFSTSYLNKFPQFKENPGLFIHFHFTVSALWILLLITQPLLMRYRKHQTHKILGKVSYYLFPLVLASMIPLFIRQYRMGYLPLVVLTACDITSFAIFYLLAIVNRKDVTRHMRYMIALILLFALPAMGRILSRWLGLPFILNMHIEFAFICTLLVALVFRDKVNLSNYRPYLVSLLIFAFRQTAIYTAYFTV